MIDVAEDNSSMEFDAGGFEINASAFIEMQTPMAIAVFSIILL